MPDAQWLWQWLQLQKPDLPPFVGAANFQDIRGDHPEYLAVQSLLHFKIIDDATLFAPAQTLAAATMQLWLKRAAALLKKPVTKFAANSAITRGAFCQQLYNLGD